MNIIISMENGLLQNLDHKNSDLITSYMGYNNYQPVVIGDGPITEESTVEFESWLSSINIERSFVILKTLEPIDTNLKKIFDKYNINLYIYVD